MCNREKEACLEDMPMVVTFHSQQALAAVQVFCVHLQEGPQEAVDLLNIHTPIKHDADR